MQLVTSWATSVFFAPPLPKVMEPIILSPDCELQALVPYARLLVDLVGILKKYDWPQVLPHPNDAYCVAFETFIQLISKMYSISDHTVKCFPLEGSFPAPLLLIAYRMLYKPRSAFQDLWIVSIEPLEYTIKAAHTMLINYQKMINSVIKLDLDSFRKELEKFDQSWGQWLSALDNERLRNNQYWCPLITLRHTLNTMNTEKFFITEKAELKRRIEKVALDPEPSDCKLLELIRITNQQKSARLCYLV